MRPRPLPRTAGPGVRGARVLAAAALSAAVLTACSIRQRAESAAERVRSGRQLSVCVLVFDGLSKESFDRNVAEGSIPTIATEIVERGLSYDTAVCSIPTETYPNLGALETGYLPGHHGIPANIWLDRSLKRIERHTNIFRIFKAADFLVPEARTIFERLPGDSVVVTTPLARGCAVHARNVETVIASYLRNDWDFLDRKTLDDVGDAYAGALRAGQLPSVVWGHLLGPDEVAHESGPASEEARENLHAADRAFARLVRRLRRWKVYDRILFVVVGDHGHATYDRVVSAEELVHRVLFKHPTGADCAGESCVLVPERGKAKAEFDVGDADVAVGAYRGAMIWLPATHVPENLPDVFRSRKMLRKKRRLQKRTGPPPPLPPPSLFAEGLAKLPEVEAVAVRGPAEGVVELYGHGGRSVIHREEDDDGERFVYTVLSGPDPLGYPEKVRDRPLSPSQWLALTAALPYPDTVYQLTEFFDSPRAPDVLFWPRDGIGFVPRMKGGHGGLSRIETVVPLVFAGPGVAPGRRPAARTVDLTPTLLRYLGVPFDADDLDGVPRSILSEPVGPWPPLPRPHEISDEEP